MTAIIVLLDTILQLYTWVLIVAIVMSWLFAFGVINRHNQVVDAIYRAVVGLTEPLLRPIRNVLPSMGGLDLSPIILFLVILFLRTFLMQDLLPMLV